MKNRMTIKEAVFKWVGELNCIPTDIIRELIMIFMVFIVKWQDNQE